MSLISKLVILEKFLLIDAIIFGFSSNIFASLSEIA
jgi:hypothetical protein